jgi:pyruvate dehydrogenase E1 component alpha subunit
MTDTQPRSGIPQAHKLHLNREHALHLLKEMLRIRALEERCAELYTEEKIRGFLHLCSGEEALADGVMQSLTPTDAVVTTYREHGHALARGLPMDRLMAEMYGKQDGVSRGRGGSMHLFDAERHFFGGSAIVAGGIPLAVGLALADRMQERAQVTACFFGEGAAAEGAFHESLNLAALWRLPVLFVCENNLYAMGTALERSESETDIARKAACYQIPSVALDGMDVIGIEAAAREASAEIRAGEGPRFLECRTYRFRAHSMFDAQLYRDKTEVAQWKQKGPILRFRHWLEEAGMLDADTAGRLDADVEQELAAAIDFAESATWEPEDNLTRDVCG